MPEPKPEPVSPFRFQDVAPRGDLIERIQTLVEENLRPLTLHIEDPVSGAVAPAILTSAGISAVPASIFNDYLDGPRTRKGTASFTSLNSFIAHVNRFKTDDSAVFADENRQAPKLTAVLDYHAAGGDSPASHGGHRSTFAFPMSDEWNAWRKVNGVSLNLRDFAELIEDRITDVIPPDLTELTDNQRTMVDKLGGPDRIASPSMLFELSKGLAVRENANVVQAINLSSGEGQITFSEEHTDLEGRPLIIPTTFLLGIPVFRGGEVYQVLARLRYSVKGGLSFKVDLWREDQVFDHAFTEATEKVHAETESPVFLGAPEAS
jgi:uncharacterized protein YfdQ (DUF2303 family)